MTRAVEQIVLVLTHWWQALHKGFVDVDVTRRAGAAASAQSKKLVDLAFANELHDGVALLARDMFLFAFAGHDDQCCYGQSPLVVNGPVPAMGIAAAGLHRSISLGTSASPVAVEDGGIAVSDVE